MSRQKWIGVAALAAAIVGSVALYGPLEIPGRNRWQGVVAAAGALLLAWDARLRRRGRAGWAQAPRDAGLTALVAVSFFLLLAPMGFGFERFLHGWDAFHYYVGGKYFRELGHYRLYDCTLIADAEAFGPTVGRTALRDLRTNEMKPARAVLQDREACKAQFTPERWQAFADDVAFFRVRMPPAKWLSLRTDHGYNPPPTWGLLGTPLTNLAAASETQLTALLLIDTLLIVAMLGVVAWAFGGRVMGVAFLFLANNYPASWDWVGGSVLRYDWLFAAVTGICLLRRGRHAAGGALLTWSAALRIFPLLLLATVGLGRALQMLSARRLALEPGDRRLLAGSLGAALALFVGATAVAGGLAPWAEFVEKSRIHLDTPLANYAGLRSVIAYDHDLREAVTVKAARGEDPYARWREGRRETFAARAPIFWILVAAYLALLTAAVRRRPEWIAAVLGAAAIPVVFELTSYYHAILLVLAFLWPLRAGVGIGLLAFAAFSRLVEAFGLHQDEILLYTNLATLALGVGATAAFVRGDPPERAES
jgi:hypothetical protein